ncbi:MAG: hypothetical protein CMJ31_14605 [Phycisphaerae bacterium]|nr:hypothetical protein [Phycisphaerae bacterium]
MQPKTPIVKRALAAALLSALALGAGCGSAPRAVGVRPPEGLRTANLGASSAAVFASPEIAAAIAVMDFDGVPEYSRNNRELSFEPNRRYTAVDDWPQPGIPDIRRRRTTTIFRNDRTFQFFLPNQRQTPYGRRY